MNSKMNKCNSMIKNYFDRLNRGLASKINRTNRYKKNKLNLERKQLKIKGKDNFNNKNKKFRGKFKLIMRDRQMMIDKFNLILMFLLMIQGKMQIEVCLDVLVIILE